MHSVIVGSGPAAVGAILALEADISQQLTLLDIGEQLSPAARAALGRMAGAEPRGWSAGDLALVTAQPERLERGALPEKRSYGSNYMFADRGQQAGLRIPADGNQAAVSGALGGFSNVWGAQIMPFSRSTFARWPFGWDEIEPHYRAVLGEVRLAADDDDYAEDFPLLNAAAPLPQVAARTAAVLTRYERNRAKIRARGALVGKARLAFAASDCVRCGLCMTGCPYSLIYSARHTVERLVASGRIKYLDRILVTDVTENAGGTPTVRGIDQGTGRVVVFEADRVFLAAGGLGTARIALNSMPAPPRTVDLLESVQFLVPFVSRVSTGDPRAVPAHDFTLNQFNILLKYDDEAYTTSQIHCYPYNPAIAAAMPSWLPGAFGGAVLGRVTAGLGYLPSWRSPRLALDLTGRRELTLPDVTLRTVTDERPALLRSVLRRLLALGPKLDLYPVLPMVRLSGPGKSYHFGGSFPHGTGSDLLGRIGGWRNIHLIDGSVLPSIPSTTFTLSVMANAHRIATASRDG